MSLIALPAIFSCLILFSSFFIYNSNYKETIKNNSTITLEHFCRHQDETTQNISLSISALSEDQRFFNTVEGMITDTADITYVQKILRKIKLNTALIDSIAIFEKTSQSVYTNNNIYTADEYFSVRFNYENYSYEFWSEYKSPLSEKTILPPSIVTENDETKKHIIPVVFTRINDKHLKNIIIMNLDINYIISQYDNYKVSDNSSFYLVNTRTKQLFSKNKCEKLTDELYEHLEQNTSNSFNYTTSEKNYVISYTPKFSTLDCTYMSMIPYKDITHATLKFTSGLLIVALVAILLLALLIFIATKKAYSPFQKILSLFGSDTKNQNIDTIHTLVSDTLNTNRNLSAELHNTLPIIEEQYLIRLLNSSSHYSVNDFNWDEKISFQHNFFCSIVIRFHPNDSFYAKYSPYEERIIELSLFDIIHQEFAADYKTYIIPSDEHRLYILLNLASKDSDADICSKIHYLQSLLKNDSEDMKLSIAYGGIYEGLSGLKHSHTKAIRELSGTQWITNLHVKTEENEKRQILRFSQTDETTIYNYILSGNTSSALKLINDLLDFNVSQNVAKSDIIQLYIQIFNLLFKIMRAKKIEYDEENVGDIKIINDITSNNLEEIHNIMVSLIQKISNFTSTKKLDISKVLEYIHTNYAKNESLDSLAEYFGVSASHLSRLIKKETASTFTDYVNKLRINESKRLLESTNETLTSIFEKVGFNNRNTFIRLFKQIVGTTPSEYRKNLKQ